jgi:hypothetical protein
MAMSEDTQSNYTDHNRSSNMTFRMTARTFVKFPEPEVRQQYGWPYPLLWAGVAFRYLERPVVLLIEEKPEIVCLYRYTAEGRFISDTWHRTVDGAKQQAGLEFNDYALDWALVPSEVEDVVLFELSERSEER